VQAFLAHASEAAATQLRGLSDEDLLDLFEELWELPCVDLSLQVELPKLLSPVLSRLCEAVEDDDPDPDLLDAATRSIDGPIERARLARAAISRAEVGVIDRELAAAALLDLGSGSRHPARRSAGGARRAGRRRRDSGRHPARRVALRLRGQGARPDRRPDRSPAPGRPG